MGANAPDTEVLDTIASMARAAAQAAKEKQEGKEAGPDTEALESLANIATAAAAAAAEKRARKPDAKKLEGLRFVAEAPAAAAAAWQEEMPDEQPEEDVGAMMQRRKSRIATVELRDPAYIAKRAAFRNKKEAIATRILERFVQRLRKVS